MISMFWLAAIGLGMTFHGLMILWVAGLPLTLQGRLPKAAKGTTEAFGIFWIEQYRFIGFSLVIAGSVLAAAGYFL